MDYKNWKTWLKSALGGSIVFVAGNYLVPIVDGLKFIPTTNLFMGLGWDDVVAFGLAFALAMSVSNYVVKE